MNSLKNLSQIFESRLLRIPDYQRGYAWQQHELDYFWEDLMNLRGDRVHYTGVITLEPLSKDETSSWEDDKWIIEDLDYSPFYVVDGQQRLTTSVVLICAILEKMDADDLLNHEPVYSHFQKYILKQDGEGLRRSFIFGYTKDDPSFEYLKTEVFGQSSSTNAGQLTLYTQNLANAKKFFVEKLQGMDKDEIGQLFKKLTKQFKFNLYEIDSEIDVFVTFETMNNRGKSLSSLEILKNRLIYLSTLFQEENSREVLRKDINESWKTIYEYLGKNPANPLDDNLFLRNHWTMYFKYSRKKGDDYIKFLLDEKFTTRNVLCDSKDADFVSLKEISNYVKSLQDAARYWFYMHNPYLTVPGIPNDDENKKLLDRLERLSFRSFKPLILAAYCKGVSFVDVNKLLLSAERYNFILFTLCQRRSNTGDTEFFSAARELLRGQTSIDDIVSNIEEWITRYYSSDKFKEHIKEKFIYGYQQGFYRWDGIRYFLYEYEDSLRDKSKNAQRNLNWHEFIDSKKDHVSVEHIYPQTETDEWAKCFVNASDRDKHYCAHSLGNLLPLSRSKNSTLLNKPYRIKKDDGKGCGYYNGCCSENEVNKEETWGVKQIRERGLSMLAFLEDRWKVDLGNEEFKISLLGLDFDNNENIKSNSGIKDEAA